MHDNQGEVQPESENAGEQAGLVAKAGGSHPDRANGDAESASIAGSDAAGTSATADAASQEQTRRQGESAEFSIASGADEPAREQGTPAQSKPQPAEPASAADDNPLIKAQKRIRELEGALLRAQADIENINRRSARQVGDAHKYAIERFSLEVLLLRDHLEMGAQSLENLDTRNENACETIRKGFEMVLNSFPAMLQRFDISEIECEGQPFDPNFHEAVGQVEDAGAKPNHIVSVKQKGYKISDRLLRPALVVVAR